MNILSKQLYFIALLPPKNVQEIVTQIKQEFAEKYQSKAALKSPPHITLQPPFEWDQNKIDLLENHLTEFTQIESKIPIILNGFAAFKPRVIYINVLKTPELLTIQKNLTNYLESSLNIVDQRSKNHPFSPHLTVGFRDLTKDNFHKAWLKFEHQPIYFEFTIATLTLLIHNGHCWKISKEFAFKTVGVQTLHP
jgi:2'-5' RNA ligase